MKVAVLLMTAALAASAQPIITESIPDLRTGVYKGKRRNF